MLNFYNNLRVISTWGLLPAAHYVAGKLLEVMD
jgi:hypothetical protein